MRSALAVVLGLLAAPLAAQQWPAKPIIFVATGAADAATRIVGEEASKAFGQQIVLDQHAGASGTISAEYALRQPSDGYTFLAATSALLAATHTFKPSSRASIFHRKRATLCYRPLPPTWATQLRFLLYVPVDVCT